MTENSPLPPILGQAKSRIEQNTGNPLHILTLTPFFPSQQDEASGCFVSEPLAVLSEIGIQNTVVAVQPFYCRRADVRRDGVAAEWFRYFSFPRGIGLPFAGAFVFSRIVSRLRQLHRARHIDLIHAHAALPCGHAAMLLSAELGIPYVVSVHGLDAFSSTQVSGRAGKWCLRISQKVYRSSQRVICVSERVREEVLQGTNRGCRTSVVYNGVDPELFSADTGTPSKDLTILSVGDLIPTKGHDVLLRSFATLVSEFPNLKLKIIGEGPERSSLQKLARRLQVLDRVKFCERRSRTAIAAAMRSCTIFALPSRYEGLGCVYLEAMSVAKPVIGCRGQGIAEIIQHGTNGFLVGPDNAKELGLAMAMLLRDQAWRSRMGRAARDTILDRLTLTHQARNLARIYREASA